MFFLARGSRETKNPSLFLSLEEHPVGALSAAWSFAEALKRLAGQVNRSRSGAQKVVPP
jgi:hypothetical protein